MLHLSFIVAALAQTTPLTPAPGHVAHRLLSSEDVLTTLRQAYEEKPGQPLSAWKDLIDFVPPQTALDAVQAKGDGWHVQAPSDAKGPYSLDYYSFLVSKLPKDPTNGEKMTAASLFLHMRQMLVDHPEAEPMVQFEVEEGKKIGDVGSLIFLKFKFGVSSLQNVDVCAALPWDRAKPVCEKILSWFDANIGNLNLDDGYIVVSKSTPKEWRVTTVYAKDAFAGGHAPGAHPVSGTRAWGYTEKKNGSIAYYVMGADRATSLPGAIENPWQVEAVGFAAADVFWRNYVDHLIKFVNENEGEAKLSLATAGRVSAGNF